MADEDDDDDEFFGNQDEEDKGCELADREVAARAEEMKNKSFLESYDAHKEVRLQTGFEVGYGEAFGAAFRIGEILGEANTAFLRRRRRGREKERKARESKDSTSAIEDGDDVSGEGDPNEDANDDIRDMIWLLRDALIKLERDSNDGDKRSVEETKRVLEDLRSEMENREKPSKMPG